MQLYVANTHPDWFDELSRRAVDGVVDEACFWSPSATRPLNNAIEPGVPIFLRLRDPFQQIAGYGFYGSFRPLRVDLMWDWFGPLTGAESRLELYERMAELRKQRVEDVARDLPTVGCTVLREVRLWPESRWIRWSTEQGWKVRSVRGDTERDPERAERLLAEIRRDAVEVPEDLAFRFVPLEVDERALALAPRREREGQGTFRVRLLRVYGGCAITGEQTEPVLEAAHIQPYLGPRSNHLQNGLLLTREFHVLFDQGYVTVGTDDVVRVSPRLRADWRNGTRYYAYDQQPLRRVPTDPGARASTEALEWHRRHKFKG